MMITIELYAGERLVLTVRTHSPDEANRWFFRKIGCHGITSAIMKIGR